MAESATATRTHRQAQPEADNGRSQLLEMARRELRDGESLFDIASYPHLMLFPVTSSIKTLSEVGIESDTLKDSSERGQRARSVIFNDGDPEKGYRFTARRLAPFVRESAYASIEELAIALNEWLKAVPEFNKASVLVGAKGVLRKNYFVDGGIMGTDTPKNAAVLLKDHLEKGINLVLQGAAYGDIKPEAVRFANANGFSASTKAKTPRATQKRDEF